MSKRCPFPDERCSNRYWNHPQRGGQVAKCRLDEWKKKIGVCPYDKSIRSGGVKKKVKDLLQKRLI